MIIIIIWLLGNLIRVMGAVQRAVFRLNEPEKLDAFLRELGRKHVGYGANVEYIDVSAVPISNNTTLNATLTCINNSR